MSAKDPMGRGDMAPTMGLSGEKSDHGKTAAVDERLAKLYGGRPATWHGRRCGRNAVNKLAATVIKEWRQSGDQEELALWVSPIEAALGAVCHPGGDSPRLRAALADAVEDEAEARYIENPCEGTARVLLRKRAADRLASMEYDQEIAARHGLTL